MALYIVHPDGASLKSHGAPHVLTTEPGLAIELQAFVANRIDHYNRVFHRVNEASGS